MSTTTHSDPHSHALTIDNINPSVKKAQYAVRGELSLRAEKYRQALKTSRPPTPSTGSSSDQELPFSTVISANIGNPQQLDQKPLTFFRQVASLVENPELLEKEDVLVEHLGYQRDVIDRARWLLEDVKSVGAYSASQGSNAVRESVARYIEERDGHTSSPSSIYLTAGASSAVNTLMNIIVSSSSTGILLPIPQYPLYSATLSLLSAVAVPYHLEESTNWSTSLPTIASSLQNARNEGTDVRAIAIINPGNPTGSILSAEEIKDIITFAAKEQLVIIADEVYQQNIFSPQNKPFVSFKKVLRDLQTGDSHDPLYDNVELASLHSISKGMTGECGHRGGYMELIGFSPEVVEQIYKFVSISLCPPVVGQCLVECMVNPPRQGDPSYPLYKKEYETIFSGMKSRAEALYSAFCGMEGVTCQKPEGSMYLFPRIKIPQKAEAQAQKENRAPDEFYVSEMLDKTGVCMVPGGGFGQVDGTWHFRTTFLPDGTEWIERLKGFHGEFMGRFRD